MSWSYGYCESVELHVKDRICPADAQRQELTARDILRRLQSQPGVILADEVGMGKTFVALAVAVSVALADEQKRSVVVMVPSSLKEKWPRDFELFKERCLPQDRAPQLRSARAERGVQFLKLLDDPPERRKSIIFLTHGAMSAGLTDPWVKLAVIQRSLYRRHNTGSLRRALHRVLPRLLMISRGDVKDPRFWEKLLNTEPADWLRVMRRHNIDPERDNSTGTDDDPVPKAVVDVLQEISAEKVYESLNNIPVRESKYFEEKLMAARHEISDELRRVWRLCLEKIHFKLPLLILDEAHHLKNARTRLASLFQVQEAHEDAEEIRGVFADDFERMLFMTATPFQLGHHELCSVLERFNGVSWEAETAPPGGQEPFQKSIACLREKLDAAQESAVTLDHAWGQLKKEDLAIDGKYCSDVVMWWKSILEGASCTAQTGRVLECFRRVEKKMREAEGSLAPWVIRHIKAKDLPEPFCGTKRRNRLVGESIYPGREALDAPGICISGDSVLPFLLAARAVAYKPESRPVFAEGLASSYEAFMLTRRSAREQTEDSSQLLDLDHEEIKISSSDDTGKWYLDRLEGFLSLHGSGPLKEHPKIDATVRRVIDAWQSGEKVLVFCHYIATGRSLRQRISEAIRQKIVALGREKLGCSETEVLPELERLGQRFFDVDSPARRACEKSVKEILIKYPDLSEHESTLVDVVRRYVRTPTFLARYFALGKDTLGEGSMAQALQTKDGSGQTLQQVLEEFFLFLQKKCGRAERESYIRAAGSVQTGTYSGADVGSTYADDELQGEKREQLVPNVRLVNGDVKPETRQKLMLTFNTPFYPEVLIASSVMAEGVDLHLSCRYVIHHDLCWNPSTLEQRTGRVDRIGAKIERCGLPLQVYLPFISETQDEKMYRVVADRERWFRVIMGEDYKNDLRTTEKLAERVPFPEIAAHSLAFRLETKTKATDEC
jgi:ERCC4-related helicase